MLTLLAIGTGIYGSTSASRKKFRLKEPKAVMGVDLNFNNVTHTIVDLSGNMVSMDVIPFKGLSKALHLKKLAERL